MRLISADSVQVYKGSDCRCHEHDIEIGVFSRLSHLSHFSSYNVFTVLHLVFPDLFVCRVAGLDIGSNKPSPEEQDRYQKARSKVEFPKQLVLTSCQEEWPLRLIASWLSLSLGI